MNLKKEKKQQRITALGYHSDSSIQNIHITKNQKKLVGKHLLTKKRQFS